MPNQPQKFEPYFHMGYATKLGGSHNNNFQKKGCTVAVPDFIFGGKVYVKVESNTNFLERLSNGLLIFKLFATHFKPMRYCSILKASKCSMNVIDRKICQIQNPERVDSWWKKTCVNKTRLNKMGSKIYWTYIQTYLILTCLIFQIKNRP